MSEVVQKVLCPKCKGRGTVIDREAAVFTLGLSILLDFDGEERKKCPSCKGKGSITL